MRRECRPEPRLRLAVAQVVILLVFLGLAGRAAHLSLLDRRGFEQGERQRRTALSLSPERGAILARGGQELALSVDAPSVYALPAALEDPARAASALAKALGSSRSHVSRRLAGRHSFVFIERWAEPEVAERVRALGLRGVGIVEEPRRIYPYRELAGPLVGFANIDGEGVRGIEQQEDDWLRGAARRLPVERDGSGQLLVDRGDEDWITTGGDVVLTIDVTLQSDARQALAEAVRATGARAGSVVAVDPASGDILALAEWPGFDPNGFRSLSYAETRSRAFLDALEPGSTLKAFLVAAALDGGSLRPDDVVDCENGSLALPGKTIRDAKPHGPLRPGDILRVSSNVGAVKIAFGLGSEAHVSTLRRFGFGAPTGSGFPDESAGLLRTLPASRRVDHATLAFGQGVSVTPVQLAAATAALANGGRLMRPRLVAARRRPGGAWQTSEPEVVRRVVSERTAQTVLAMLETVTGSDGTGRRAALRGVPVGGKTGTAQKFDARRGRYSEQDFVAWFIGVAPAEAPRLAIAVALDGPRRPTHTGGVAAAPLFARVAAAQLARLGILTEPEPALPAPAEPAPPLQREPPARSLPQTRTAAAKPAPAPRPAARRRVPELVQLEGRVLLPDFSGYTVAELRELSAATELSVRISGRGRAVSQEPPPGTVVAARGARIEVHCEPGADPI
ncbi:MAG: penicillin-binding protein [Myxococcota bacterium]|nr:penicillin-binding protein [Myxococcota bacterium]